MAIKKLRPITPGQRFRLAPVFDDITTSTPEKSLLVSNHHSGGRNSDGRRSMRYIGGGHKRQLRLIDFKRDKYNVPAVVKTIEYDPNRTARIALLNYVDGEKRYIIAPKGLKVGTTVQSGKGIAPEVGNTMYLSDIPLGTLIHNIELKPGKGASMARSAGTYAQLLARDSKYATIKLPSSEMRLVLLTCTATIGTVSNADHMNTVMGKAGRNRWMGVRPRVRGVVMNPVDHPMGGGEGRSSGGQPRSRNGVYSRGLKTRANRKYSDKLIIGKKK